MINAKNIKNKRPMTDNKINIKNFLLWILSLTAFILMRPYFVWTTYGSGVLSLLFQGSLSISALLIVIYLLMNNRKINRAAFGTIILLIIVRMYMLMTGIDKISFLAFGNYIVLIIIIAFFILTEQERKEVFNNFALIFAISLVPAIIIWFLTNSGIQLPYQYLATEHVGKAAKGAYYQKYFGAAFLSYPYFVFQRLSGMFDEPGVVGTFAALFLAGDEFRLKGRLRNIIILIGGMLSFSMAFYILIIITLAIKSFNKGFLKFSIVLILIILSYNVIMTIETDNYIISEIFQKRLKIVAISLAEDKRTSQSFNYEFDKFMKGDFLRILFGYGSSAYQNNPSMFGSYTYKILIYDFGVIGYVMLLVWIIYATKKIACFDGRTLMLMIVFVISIYQRPFVLSVPYMFLLFGGYANLKNIGDVKQKNSINCSKLLNLEKRGTKYEY